MKLALKQKVFSLKESFQVMDEEGNPSYEVAGKLLSIGTSSPSPIWTARRSPTSTRRS